jgi:hypothetical protein
MGQRLKEIGLSDNPTELVHGTHGGYQAINLAVLMGAAKIVLLGYDMRVSSKSGHWHDGHPGQDIARFEHNLRVRYLPAMRHLIAPLAERGIEICTARPSLNVPHSAIDWWPQCELAEVL